MERKIRKGGRGLKDGGGKGRSLEGHKIGRKVAGQLYPNPREE